MSFFEKFIGRHRAVALRLWLYEFGALGIVGILFLAAAVSMVLFFELEPHRHDSFRSGKIQGIVPMGGKSGGYLVDLELEDGTHLRLMTARGAILGASLKLLALNEGSTPSPADIVTSWSFRTTARM